MKIRTSGPQVFLVAQTRLNTESVRALLVERGWEWSHDDATRPDEVEWRLPVRGTDASLIVEVAGRFCYNSFEGDNGAGMGRKTNAEYVDHIIKVGHTALLEHVTYTFTIVGVGRGFTHEAVRHRVGTAFAQRSTRFCDEGDEGTFVVPPLLRGVFAQSLILRDMLGLAVSTASGTYRSAINFATAHRLLGAARLAGLTQTEARKTLRGAARAFLPIGTEAPIVITGNARMWRHFFDMRATRHAELEIREVAVLIWRQLVADDDTLFGDYTEITLPDGTSALNKEENGHD
jgi:thymidylate synthase (FAD)